MTMPGPRLSIVVSSLMTFAGLAMWVVSLRSIDPSRVDALGLVSVVGPLFLGGLAVLCAAFALSLTRARPPGPLLLVQLVSLVVVLYTVASIVEPEPAYFSAYLHAGFTNYIAQHGNTLPMLDARFNWPGAFSLAALVSEASGLHNAVLLIRWAPLFFELLYLAPLWVIVSAATRDTRARWAAMFLFYLSNWVAQDYLSPQALNFFFFLVLIAIVVTWFRGGDRTATAGRALVGRLRGLLASDAGDGSPDPRDWVLRPDARAVSRPQRSALVVAILGIAGAVTISHQATPIFIVLALAGLVVVGRLSAPTLPFIVGLMFLVYVSFGAEDFWRGHMSVLLGGIGHLDANVNANVSGRIKGTDLHRLVLYLRFGLAATTALLAAVGLLRGWFTGKRRLLWGVLAVAPLGLVGLQSYGGEAVLRSYLFALPFLCIMAVAVLPRASLPVRVPGAIVISLAVVVLAVGFVGARYGNEQFEQVPSSDLHAVQWVYGHALRGSVIVAASRNLPWRYQDLNGYQYVPGDDAILSSTTAVIAFMKTRPTAAYFISTDSQELFGQELYGLSPGWLHRLDADLEGSGEVKVVFKEGGARVYALYGSPGVPR